MRNKDKVLGKLDTALKVNELVMDDTLIGGLADIEDGWIRGHYQTMKMLLEDIKETIDREEIEF